MAASERFCQPHRALTLPGSSAQSQHQQGGPAMPYDLLILSEYGYSAVARSRLLILV